MEEISKACLVISKGMNTPLQLTGCIAALCKAWVEVYLLKNWIIINLISFLFC